jgi:hypothetical protein
MCSSGTARITRDISIYPIVPFPEKEPSLEKKKRLCAFKLAHARRWMIMHHRVCNCRIGYAKVDAWHRIKSRGPSGFRLTVRTFDFRCFHGTHQAARFRKKKIEQCLRHRLRRVSNPLHCLWSHDFAFAHRSKPLSKPEVPDDFNGLHPSVITSAYSSCVSIASYVFYA